MKIISPDADFDWNLAQLVNGWNVGITLVTGGRFDFHIDAVGWGGFGLSFVALKGRRVRFEDEFGDSITPRYSDREESHCLIDITELRVY